MRTTQVMSAGHVETTSPFDGIRTALAPVSRAWPGVNELPALGALLAILVGGIVLLGWWLGLDGLKSLLPGMLTMKVNTAVAFGLLGVGMLARSRPARSRWHRLGAIPLVAMMLLTAAVGSQYATGGDLGIDQWLFRELPGQVGTVQPNRMSPMTVVCFLLIGTGVLLSGGIRTRRCVPALLVVALVLASLNVLDFVFNATVPSLLAGYTQMALNTAATMLLVSIAAMGLLPNGGPLEVYIGSPASAGLARRLVVASLVAPVLLAWLRLQGEQRGLYGTNYGASLMVLGTFIFLATVIWQTARSARATEMARVAALEERDRFFDFSTDLLATASPDGYFIRLNPAWTVTLGHDRAELLSRPFSEFVHPDDRAATQIEVARQVYAGKTVVNFENRYRHRDGTYRWLEWTSTPSADGSHLYAIARDVTSRKEEEARRLAPLIADRERLAEARHRIEATIEGRAFRPVFQPVIHLSSGAIVGFEALTRFADGCRPDVMFATALECGRGIELEMATLGAALREARFLPREAWLSLNVSPTMLRNIETLRPMLDKARSIVLEITEHEAIGAYEPLRAAMARLGSDVRLAVDDVGAGVANFNHLVELRPDFVKIDASLVRGVDTDLSRAALLVGLVHFAAAAGCQVVAEGIETEAERTTVERLGVMLGQGFLLAKPAPAESWHSIRDPDVRTAIASSAARRRQAAPVARRRSSPAPSS